LIIWQLEELRNSNHRVRVREVNDGVCVRGMNDRAREYERNDRETNVYHQRLSRDCDCDDELKKN